MKKFLEAITLHITKILMVIVILLLIIEIISDKFNIFNYIPNFNTEVLSILLTVYLVEKAIEKNKKKNEKERFFSICYNDYKILITDMSNRIACFITHGNYKLDKEEMETTVKLDKYIGEIDNLFDDDFIKKPFKFISADTLKEISVDYLNFNKYYFKDPINRSINDFLHKYISIIPDDIRDKMFQIQNQLKENILYSPLSSVVEHQLDLKNREMNIEVECLNNVIKNIAENAKYLTQFIKKQK